MWRAVARKLGAVAMATLVIGLAACGGDDGDEATAREAANREAWSGALNVNRYLMRR